MGRPCWVIGISALAVGCSVDDPRMAAVEQAVSQCGSAVVEGLDVYDGQGTIDWGQVKASGRDFAFIKATQGDYNHQTKFAANWTNAAAAGVLRSAYHFFDPTIDGVLQAQSFLDAVGSAGGMTTADLPAMLDIECPVAASESTAKSEGASCEYAGNSGWIAPATMKQRVFDWVATVTAATGRAPIVYSYPSWFADVGFTDADLGQLPLFIASYNTCATVPAPWETATFWQYSATTAVPGITGKLDVDRFFGSAGDLAAWNASTLPDAGVPIGPDAGEPGVDAGAPPPMQAAGCGCDTGTRSPGAGALLLATLVGVQHLRRLRRRARGSDRHRP